MHTVKMTELGVLAKFEAALEESNFDGLLIYGTDHVEYLSGAVLPFLHAGCPDTVAVFCGKSGPPVLLAPAELKDSLRRFPGIPNVQVYDPHADSGGSPEELAARLIGEELTGKGTIGTTFQRISPRRMSALKELLPRVDFLPADRLLRDLRMVKTGEERELLEEAAFRMDHALAAAAHHVMVYAQRPEKGLSEIIRVHGLERGLDMTGYEALAVGASGVHAALPWPEAPYFGVGLGKTLEKGELVRMELRGRLDGYWADGARPLTMGPADDAQRRAHDSLLSIKRELLRRLQPGVPLKTAAEEVESCCKSSAVEFRPELGLGHGIGVRPLEPPFIHRGDDTLLQSGMVLVLTPTVSGPKGELLRSFDTVVVEKGGARVVGKYREWEMPYEAASSYQHGGG